MTRVVYNDAGGGREAIITFGTAQAVLACIGAIFKLQKASRSVIQCGKPVKRLG